MGVNLQLIDCHSSDFNELEIPLTDTPQQKENCSEIFIVKWLSYTLNRPPLNGKQEGQAQPN